MISVILNDENDDVGGHVEGVGDDVGEKQSQMAINIGVAIFIMMVAATLMMMMAAMIITMKIMTMMMPMMTRVVRMKRMVVATFSRPYFSN